jgi:hypothetical protein
MAALPPLDAHAHIAYDRMSLELPDNSAVLAMTLSLDEATLFC